MPRLDRIDALCFAAALLWVALAPGTAHGQSFPDKSVRIIVHTTPGGASDSLARALAPKLTEYWGQAVVVENRPGAGGNTGHDLVAKSPPDGYTLLLGSVGPLTINPHLFKNLPYDPMRDFSPVSLLAHIANIMVVNPSIPASSVKEFIAFARPRPGQLHFGSAGNGQSQHLAGELFNIMAGVKMQHVPYKGSAPALVDVIGGQIALTFTGLTSGLPHVKTGRLRALAVTSARRQTAAPEVPTVSEAGLPGFVITAWHGLLAPGGVPRELITKMHRDTVRAFQSADVKDRLTAQGAELVVGSPEEFSAHIRSELAKWGKLVREANVRPD